MVSLRASGVDRLVACLASLALAPPLAGCSLMHHGAQGDAGADAAVVMLVLDAGPPPPAAPANVNRVGRFPDEVSLSDAPAKILDPNVAARNAVPGGALVATLHLGTPVMQVAKHESFVLCIFPDPKDPTRNLEGWVAEQAFVAGATVPSKGSCPTGKVKLMFDEQDFCGRVCKSDSDCPSGQTCGGKASLLTNGKVGAEVTTCTIPPGGGDGGGGGAGDGGGVGAGSGASAARVVPGVQMDPFPGNVCPDKFVLAPDKLCHRDCAKGEGPCPHGSKCVHGLGVAVCEAQ